MRGQPPSAVRRAQRGWHVQGGHSCPRPLTFPPIRVAGFPLPSAETVAASPQLWLPSPETDSRHLHSATASARHHARPTAASGPHSPASGLESLLQSSRHPDESGRHGRPTKLGIRPIPAASPTAEADPLASSRATGTSVRRRGIAQFDSLHPGRPRDKHGELPFPAPSENFHRKDARASRNLLRDRPVGPTHSTRSEEARVSEAFLSWCARRDLQRRIPTF
jgi:hypothetical protein